VTIHISETLNVTLKLSHCRK